MGKSMSMRISLKSIVPGRKQNVLAHACVEIHLDDDNMVTIDDIRIVKNKYGDMVVYAPTYSVSVGRDWTYYPTVTFSVTLKRKIEDLVLEGYRSQP